jgi:hypothetical protein
MSTSGRIENEIEQQETLTSENLDNVVNMNRMYQLRQEIKLVADNSYRKQIISDKSYLEYNKLATGKDEQGMTIDMLKNVRNFAEAHENKAKRIYDHIENAKKQKHISEVDEKYLMAKYVLQKELDFSQNFQTIENHVLKKLDNRKKDKEIYDKIANHKLVQNVGYLKIDENTKIQVPNEKEFLEMTVPERHELLKKLQEALPKAEKYAEKVGEEESQELEKEYKSRLDKAYTEDKIIGQCTYNKFWNGFQKIDNKEKKYWIKEFNDQIDRYGKLWKDIRGNLKEDELKQMESSRDKMGYTELFVKYGETKKSLDDKYKKNLEHFKEKGIIGEHVKNEFMSWIKDQDPKKKYDAIDNLHDREGGQMENYQKLWNNIEKNLSKDQRAFMESKRDGWGYTEMKNQYDQFIRGENMLSEEGKNDPLSVINSTAIKTAIIRTNIDLKKRGKGKRKTFLNRLQRMFSREQRDQFDAKGFQARLRKDRVEKQEKTLEQTSNKGITTDNMINLQQKLKEKRVEKSGRRHGDSVEKSGIEKADVVKEEGFTQIKTSEDDGHIHRKAQLEINRVKGMERFFIEDQKQQFRGKEEGGRDDLSLAVHTDDGRTVELDLTEIRAMEKYLEEEEKADLNKSA